MVIAKVLELLLTLTIALWILKRFLWSSKRTTDVLGLPRPIAGRVLAVLDAAEDDKEDDAIQQLHSHARDVLEECLKERGVPGGVYELVLGETGADHRVRRSSDGQSWSLVAFDDFIDLGLNPRGE